MPKQTNGRWPALGRPLIVLRNDCLPLKRSVLRHLLYLRDQQMQQKDDHFDSVYESLKTICANLSVQIKRKDKVKGMMTKLFNDYYSEIGKNLNRKDRPTYQVFRQKLSQTFDVTTQSLPPVKPNQPIRDPSNQFCSFETIPWDDVVISSSDEDDQGDDQDSDVVNLRFGEVVQCAIDLSNDKSKDPDYCAKLKSKLEHEVRKKILSPELLDCLDRIQLSSNRAFRLICTISEEFGIDTSKTIFSVSTINRHRHQNRADLVRNLKETTVFPQHCTLHWDGVNIFDIHLKKPVHHLAIKISGPKFDLMLAVVKNDDGSARTFVPLIINELREWRIEERVKFLNFDTTAVNTGNNRIPIFLILKGKHFQLSNLV